MLKNECYIAKRIHVCGQAFEKEALVDVVILKLIKNTTLLDSDPEYINIDDKAISKNKVIRYQLSYDNKIPFSTYATIKRGLTTGFNSVFINPRLTSNNVELREIISSPKAVVGFSTHNAICDKLLVYEKNGKPNEAIEIYLQNWRKKIIQTNHPKTLAIKIRKNEQWFALRITKYNGVIFGYIIRQDMRFIINESDMIIRDNFYIISPKIDNYLMLALLNNYYVYIQLEIAGKRYGSGLLKLQKYDLESLMLPNLKAISNADKKKLEDYGFQLAKQGDKFLIDKITKLLSKYDDVDHESIKSQYEYLKVKRLKGIL
jgi:hypothetical protein